MTTICVWLPLPLQSVMLHLTDSHMPNARLDEAKAEIKIARRNISNLRYADSTTPMAESEKLNILLMKVKVESEKVGLNSTFKKLRSWHTVPSLHGK